MKYASLFAFLIPIGIIAVIFSTISNSVFSFTPEEEAVLEKAQKSVNAQKPQGDNIATPTVSNKTDSSSGYKIYDNQTYGAKISYPKDWSYFYPGLVYYESNPEKIFTVFFSGNEKQHATITIEIEKLSPKTTLEKYKDRIVTNLKSDYPDIKGIVVSKDTLAGEPAYRNEYLIRILDHWEKSIDLFAVKNGTLYEFSVLAETGAIQKNSKDIKNMIDSVEFKQPQVNFQQIYEGQVSRIKQLSSQPNRYVNEKCGVSITLPKWWTAIPSDFAYIDQSKTLADFQSPEEDINNLHIDIEHIGYYTLEPLELSKSLREYASLGSESIIIESGIGQINGFPSYKIVYSDGLSGKYRFYTLEIYIIAYDREYRLLFEAADKPEFDKYRSIIEDMASTIKITEPKFDGINCQR